MLQKLAFLLFFSIPMAAQVNPHTAEVAFSPTGISVGGQKCFNYKKEGNRFTISDLSGNPLFVGNIRKNILGKFESTISFVTISQTFRNHKIVGRNDLVFSLLNFGVIRNCTIDSDALKRFYVLENEKPD
jgi:hypothetical protein